MNSSANLVRPKLDPNDLDQVRGVLVSSPGFSPDLPLGCVGFKRLFFNHPLFVGFGSALLEHIGIPNDGGSYWVFMTKLFPDNMGKHFIDRNGGSKGEIWRSCSEDFEYIYQAVMEPSDKGCVQEPFLDTLNALCGGARATANPEEFLMIKEQLDQLFEIMREFDDRLQYTLNHRMGLFGAEELTYNEIGLKFDVSRERIRQTLLRAIELLGDNFVKRVHPRHPIITTVSDFPDLLEILGRRENKWKKSTAN